MVTQENSHIHHRRDIKSEKREEKVPECNFSSAFSATDDDWRTITMMITIDWLLFLCMTYTRKYTSIYKIHKKISDSFIQNVNARWWCSTVSVVPLYRQCMWYDMNVYRFYLLLLLCWWSAVAAVCAYALVYANYYDDVDFLLLLSVYLYQNIYIYRNPRGLISMRVLFRYVFVVWFYRILFYFVRKYIWMDDVLLHLSTKHIIWCSTNSFVCQSHMF